MFTNAYNIIISTSYPVNVGVNVVNVSRNVHTTFTHNNLIISGGCEYGERCEHSTGGRHMSLENFIRRGRNDWTPN